MNTPTINFFTLKALSERMPELQLVSARKLEGDTREMLFVPADTPPQARPPYTWFYEGKDVSPAERLTTQHSTLVLLPALIEFSEQRGLRVILDSNTHNNGPKGPRALLMRGYSNVTRWHSGLSLCDALMNALMEHLSAGTT